MAIADNYVPLVTVGWAKKNNIMDNAICIKSDLSLASLHWYVVVCGRSEKNTFIGHVRVTVCHMNNKYSITNRRFWISK
jgi:hypothetical protein